MGYQESYVTSNNKEHFERLLKKIQSMGEEFYNSYGTYPVEIITFNKEHDNFRKGQQAIYFIGERYLQNYTGGRLIGYTDEFFEDMSEEEMDKYIDDEMSYCIIKHYTEEVDPAGIWKDAGEPLLTTHEKFTYEEYQLPEGTWEFKDLDDYSNEPDYKLDCQCDDNCDECEYEDYEEDEDPFIAAEMELREYPNMFYLVDFDEKEDDEIIDEDEEPWHSTTLSATYYDPIRNNTLILEEYRYEGEKLEDIDVVVNAISNEAYMYLMKELKSNKNVTVFWSQVFGTTGDYTIVYDGFGEGCLYGEDYVRHLMNKCGSGKYKGIRCGKIFPISREMME